MSKEKIRAPKNLNSNLDSLSGYLRRQNETLRKLLEKLSSDETKDKEDKGMSKK